MALFCQRVEDNAFHLSKVDRFLRRRCQNNRRRRRIFRAKENSAERLARPG